MPPSVSTGGRNAVVRHVRRCAAVQTPVNCYCKHEKYPTRDVEPMKFVVHYLTQAVVRLGSFVLFRTAGKTTASLNSDRNRIQHGISIIAE